MAERIDSELLDQPSAQGELRVVIGQSLFELGQPERGLALAERMELLGGDDPGLAVDYNNLAVALARMDRYADALAAYARCAELLTAGGIGDSARMAGVERGRAALLARLGKFAEAQALLARADQMRRRNLPPEHPDQRDTAFASAVLARLSGAAGSAQQRLGKLLATSPDQDPRRGEYHYELGRSTFALGQWREAQTQLTAAAEILQRTAGGTHPLAIHAQALSAYANWRQGGSAEVADLRLADVWVALDRLGLGDLDEAAEILLMRSAVATALGNDADANSLRIGAAERYAALGIAPPMWVE
jgi:tetratricopeptide (TPR) repeat protein